MRIPENPDPIALFDEWFNEARESRDVEHATTVTLATVDEDGQPHARVVLLKGHDHRGFAFYTNLTSNKARQLTVNPKAALCFYWEPIGKQVRVVGPVAPVTDQEADAYFASRPRNSQLGAWASDQSSPLAGREMLEQRLQEMERKFEGRDVPRPPHWSGFRINPTYIEFWLRGEHRLHHRRLYTRTADGGWSQELLYP